MIPMRNGSVIILVVSGFMVGIAVGWLGRGGSSHGTSTAFENKVPVRSRVTHVPNGHFAQGPASPFLGEPAALIETPGFNDWIDQMDSGNWQEILDGAMSPNAVRLDFLNGKSLESLQLLRKLGEVASEDAIRYLWEKDMAACTLEVMEGWIRKDSKVAFNWLAARQHLGDFPSEAPINVAVGRAAAVLIEMDPDFVIGNPNFRLDGPTAMELVKLVGVERSNEVFRSRWETRDVRPDGNGPWYLEFRSWLAATREVQKSGLNLGAIEDYRTYQGNRIALLNELAARPGLNQDARFLVEHELGQWRERWWKD